MGILFDVTVGVALAALALLGGMEQAFMLATGMALVEVCSLFAVRMYALTAPTELNDQKRSALFLIALLLTILGSAIAALLLQMWDIGLVLAWFALLHISVEEQRSAGHPKRALALIGIATVGILAAWHDWDAARWVFSGGVILNLIWGRNPKKEDTPKDRVRIFSADLFRALPEALLTRGVYVLPAAALCLAAYCYWHVNTVLPYAIGLAVFSALRPINHLHGAEVERFGARWVAGSLAAAVCSALGWNGIFSAAYCAWAVIFALLPVQRNASAWLCALLVLLQAVCGALAGAGVLGGIWAGAIAFALCLPVLFLQRRALYAAYLPARAWFIRRKASGK